MDKKQVELLILKLLYDRTDSLSHYQLTRKLKNLNDHALVPELTEILNVLEKHLMIAPDLSKGMDPPFFTITEEGIRFLDQHAERISRN